MVDSAKKDFVENCALPEEEFYADSFTTEADLAKGWRNRQASLQ